MNKSLFLGIFLIPFAVFSQNVSLQSSSGTFHGRIDTLLMNLDLSEVSNGILYERGYPQAEFEAYQGAILSNNVTAMMDFGFLYAY